MAAAVMTPKQRASLDAEATWRSKLDTELFVRYFRPHVRHPTEGDVLFEPYDYQCDLWAAMDKGERPVVLKARQIGISAACLMHKVRRCIGEGPVTCVVLADKQATATDRIRDARFMATHCERPFPPDWPVLVGDNKLEMEWSNGSRLQAIASSQNPGRGIAASDLVLDEFAYWPWQEEMWAAIRPTISRRGNVAIVSTPDMEGDLFHERWIAAKSGGAWTPFEWDWRQCPEYGEEWRIRESADYTEGDWAREYECEFGRAADAVFRSACIEAAVKLAARPYAVPDKPVYAMGGDLAGQGRDESVLLVLDATHRPVRLVAHWNRETAPAPTLQQAIEGLATRYDTRPWLDRTGIGWGIIENLRCEAIGVAFTGGREATGSGRQPNVPVTLLINNLILGLEQNQLAIPADLSALIMGLRAYRWKQAAGKKSANADWVDALALAWWSVTEGLQMEPMYFDLSPGGGDELF